ncbi:GNAT family N-acetyltransferase [Ferruginibacter paludis]|uniref:GNAT family N-acetyltransferase n=1 Tax=Ferruginibacter paludis TaxID=1310417 RepID=UPI0025B5D234|nr:GNAT family N-acetyltransferase [Ferruginibacter paludis]MDN3655069.1 GNAT family N-acetyltransferase [Ferruginibacter paludis]
MSQPKIETYTDIYKSLVGSLIVSIQKDEFGIPITLAMQPDLNQIPGYYQVKNGNFWIAKVGEEVAGTIALLDIGNGQAALRKMFVAKPYRGKVFGIGQGLLNTLINWAIQKDIKEIFLGTTAKFVGAQRFYEKNGFIEIAKEQLPQQFPLTAVDVKFYKYAVRDKIIS